MLKTAGGYLLVLHTLEESESGSEQCVRLLQKAKEAGDWDLCQELARFLMALDESGEELRLAVKKMNIRPGPLSIPSASASASSSSSAVSKTGNNGNAKPGRSERLKFPAFLGAGKDTALDGAGTETSESVSETGISGESTGEGKDGEEGG